MGVACDVFLDSSTIFVFLRSEYQYSSPKLIKSRYNPDYHWSSRVCFQNALGYVRTIRLNPRPNNPSIWGFSSAHALVHCESKPIQNHYQSPKRGSADYLCPQSQLSFANHKQNIDSYIHATALWDNIFIVYVNNTHSVMANPSVIRW